MVILPLTLILSLARVNCDNQILRQNLDRKFTLANHYAFEVGDSILPSPFPHMDKLLEKLTKTAFEKRDHSLNLDTFASSTNSIVGIFTIINVSSSFRIKTLCFDS